MEARPMQTERQYRGLLQQVVGRTDRREDMDKRWWAVEYKGSTMKTWVRMHYQCAKRSHAEMEAKILAGNGYKTAVVEVVERSVCNRIYYPPSSPNK